MWTLSKSCIQWCNGFLHWVFLWNGFTTMISFDERGFLQFWKEAAPVSLLHHKASQMDQTVRRSGLKSIDESTMCVFFVIKAYRKFRELLDTGLWKRCFQVGAALIAFPNPSHSSRSSFRDHFLMRSQLLIEIDWGYFVTLIPNSSQKNWHISDLRNWIISRIINIWEHRSEN